MKTSARSASIVAAATLALGVASSSYGCSSSNDAEGGTCAPVPSAVAAADCALLYEPTYANVFERTLKPTCAKSGVSCHASEGRQGGLAFEDADESYRLLVEETKVVRPGDPACSEFVARLTSTDPYYRMPPGLSLSETEQCSLIRWVANGAAR